MFRSMGGRGLVLGGGNDLNPNLGRIEWFLKGGRGWVIFEGQPALAEVQTLAQTSATQSFF